MRLADFFVGSRQLFGFLIPGTIWLFCLLIPVADKDLSVILHQSHAIDIFLFLAAALIIGTAMESLSFYLAVRTSAALFRERLSREKHDTDYFPMSVPKPLIATARNVAQRHEPVSGYILSLSNREFSQYCKQTVLEHSKRHRRRLEEYEAEVNLLAMLPLPLIVFAAVTAIWGLGGPNSLVPSVCPAERLLLPISSVLLVGLLLLRLHPLRREEAESWFRFFLMQCGDARIKKAESPGTNQNAGSAGVGL
jgi:hypothetical protein